MGTFIINSCLHKLQKLYCYNHIFLHYLQVLELDLKFVTIWKIKIKHLKVCEMFLQVYGFFFMQLTIDMVNIPIYILWLIKFVFITKMIPNSWKITKLLGTLLGYFFKSKWYDTNCLEKLKGRLKMFIKKLKVSFVLKC